MQALEIPLKKITTSVSDFTDFMNNCKIMYDKNKNAWDKALESFARIYEEKDYDLGL